MMVSSIQSTLAIVSEKVRNGGCMAIYKSPMSEDFNNPDTLSPWKFTEDIIYLIKNTPQNDYLVLRMIDEPSINDYYDEEYTQRENNEDL